MKIITSIIVALGMAIFAGPSFAACVGSDAFSSCADANGNSYTVNRMGNMTTMNGYNAQTGSNWSQNSQTLGNQTYTNGTANGRSWNETQTQFGNGFGSVTGTNSHGQPFNYSCAPYSGCN
jgi:hypothetical protein